MLLKCKYPVETFINNNNNPGDRLYFLLKNRDCIYWQRAHKLGNINNRMINTHRYINSIISPVKTKTNDYVMSTFFLDIRGRFETIFHLIGIGWDTHVRG